MGLTMWQESEVCPPDMVLPLTYKVAYKITLTIWEIGRPGFLLARALPLPPPLLSPIRISSFPSHTKYKNTILALILSTIFHNERSSNGNHRLSFHLLFLGSSIYVGVFFFGGFLFWFYHDSDFYVGTT